MASDQWTSRIGFILAAAGSAIGLGTVWRLPYVAGTEGGGAFFLIFLILLLTLGSTLLLAEFVLGRRTQEGAIRAYKNVASNGNWHWIGILGMVTAFLLLSFYSVVGGWIIAYLVRSFSGQVTSPPGGDYSALFETITANPWEVGIAHLAFMVMTILVVQRGIRKGIEKATVYMMPALFILFAVLVVRSLTLDGAWEGVVFFLQPDLSAVSGQTLLTALGQAFFSLSLGVSVMVTYSSYLGKSENLPRSAWSVVYLTILIAFMAGLVIFPSVFAFDLEPDEGPMLIFTILPAVFGEITFGSIFFTLFMILMLFATLTSAFSLVEIVVAPLIRGKEEQKRVKMTWTVGLLIFVLGIPSNLSFGLLSDWHIFGDIFFNQLDFLVSNILLPIGALLISLFVPWKMSKTDLQEELLRGSNRGNSFFSMWLFTIRYIVPIAIVVVFISMLAG
ncbi:NSS family neurotransmitter:Na+ symporter [Geomicrobium halophilum]|uniref:NSS family neurotransmitter:Na+ symporter n=1 Tax=Geomicrobium halophilum TaxID=549000 RepID=A0A841Q210_9BACL|nr:sodium-dependent transporter [Geomicrobium halophilum]MBB6450168.1 NSS family neurotransmitter:Na+ symporter [Geomicrobium halophilum]